MLTPHWQSADGAVVLFNADAREVLPALRAASVGFVWTDPPYGHNNNGGDDFQSRFECIFDRGDISAPRPIANDGPEANDLFRWCIGEAARLLPPGGCAAFCCGGGGAPDPQFQRWSSWLDEVMLFKQAVVWDKGPMGLGWHYRRSYEFVLVGQKPGAPCRWFDESNKVENIIRDIGRIIPDADAHPTIKPTELPRRFIRWHSTIGDVVLDPFMGEGTSGVAAVELGRRYIGVEIDNHWCRKAARRIRDALDRARMFDAPLPSNGDRVLFQTQAGFNWDDG